MPTQRARGTKLEDLAGTWPKRSSFGMFVPKHSEVQNCHESGWKSGSDLIIEEVSCFFGGREKKNQGTRRHPGKVERLLLV